MFILREIFISSGAVFYANQHSNIKSSGTIKVVSRSLIGNYNSENFFAAFIQTIK